MNFPPQEKIATETNSEGTTSVVDKSWSDFFSSTMPEETTALKKPGVERQNLEENKNNCCKCNSI